jgi:predicted esterase
MNSGPPPAIPTLRVLRGGPSPRDARLSLILVHGRGATAEDIVGIGAELGLADVAFVAPTAPGHTWYPQSFLAPLDENEPHLSTALAIVGSLVADLEGQGVPHARIGLLGFSQGACLSLEFAARHARRYAAVVGLSGGVIGPPGTPRDYPGSLAGTPVFLGCSDVDAHIPLARVHESAVVFRRLGADVTERIYPGMGHTVSLDELEVVRTLLGA